MFQFSGKSKKPSRTNERTNEPKIRGTSRILSFAAPCFSPARYSVRNTMNYSASTLGRVFSSRFLSFASPTSFFPAIELSTLRRVKWLIDRSLATNRRTKVAERFIDPVKSKSHLPERTERNYSCQATQNLPSATGLCMQLKRPREPLGILQGAPCVLLPSPDTSGHSMHPTFANLSLSLSFSFSLFCESRPGECDFSLFRDRRSRSLLHKRRRCRAKEGRNYKEGR